jgi:hypothetical protein
MNMEEDIPLDESGIGTGEVAQDTTEKLTGKNPWHSVETERPARKC